jgi:hypothetical protein
LLPLFLRVEEELVALQMRFLKADDVANAQAGVTEREDERLDAGAVVVTPGIALRVLVARLDDSLEIVIAEHFHLR